MPPIYRVLTTCAMAMALVMPVSICLAVSYSYGFESGTLEGWTPDATDQGTCPWHIIASKTLPYNGAWSLEYFMANYNDATKIWIERSYDVPAGRRYDVTLTWKLASRDSQVNACPIIAYVGDHDLETRFDDIQVVGYSMGGSGTFRWLPQSYTRTGVLPGTSGMPGQGKIWVAIGMWGTFEVTYYWYIDSVTVDILESAPPVSVGEARLSADGTRVFMSAKAASSGYSDLKSPNAWLRRIYVEESDRSAGIAVKHYRTFGGEPVRGSLLDVSGMIATEDGERVLMDATVSWPRTGTDAVPEPLHMGNQIVGGGPFGLFVPGVTGSVGLNNSGLLLRTFGRVASTGTGYFVIDDGGRHSPCGKSAVRGLAVSTADSLEGITVPPVDSWVGVTGLSGVFSSGGSYYPIVRVRRQSDITPCSPQSFPF